MLLQKLSSPRINGFNHKVISYRRHIIIPKATWADSIIESSRIVGEGLTLFVFFTCALNWVHYKQLREQIESTQNKQKNVATKVHKESAFDKSRNEDNPDM